MALHQIGTARRDRLRSIARSRRREGATVRAIAAEIGVPRATVGDWVRGIEGEYVFRCGLCGESFVAPFVPGKRLRYCTRVHAVKAANMRRVA